MDILLNLVTALDVFIDAVHKINYFEVPLIAVLNNIVIELSKPVLVGISDSLFLGNKYYNFLHRNFIRIVVILVGIFVYLITSLYDEVDYNVKALISVPILALLFYEISFYKRIINKACSWLDTKGASDDKDL